MIKQRERKEIHDLLDNIIAQVQYHLITIENRKKGISNKLKLTKPNSIITRKSTNYLSTPPAPR